jgi:hypothetical protein
MVQPGQLAINHHLATMLLDMQVVVPAVAPPHLQPAVGAVEVVVLVQEQVTLPELTWLVAVQWFLVQQLEQLQTVVVGLVQVPLTQVEHRS